LSSGLASSSSWGWSRSEAAAGAATTTATAKDSKGYPGSGQEVACNFETIMQKSCRRGREREEDCRGDEMKKG